jgi:hypothetical protein
MAVQHCLPHREFVEISLEKAAYNGCHFLSCGWVLGAACNKAGYGLYNKPHAKGKRSGNALRRIIHETHV